MKRSPQQGHTGSCGPADGGRAATAREGRPRPQSAAPQRFAAPQRRGLGLHPRRIVSLSPAAAPPCASESERGLLGPSRPSASAFKFKLCDSAMCAKPSSPPHAPTVKDTRDPDDGNRG